MPNASSSSGGRRRALVVGVTAAGLCTLAVVLLPDGHADAGPAAQSVDPARLVTPHVAPDMDPIDRSSERRPPTLSARRRAHIRHLVATSAPVRTAAQGSRLRVAQVAPWTTSVEPERMIGAVVTVVLAHRVALDHVPLPAAIFDRSDKSVSPYKSTVYLYSAPAVRKLWVQVDVHRDRVVDVAPDFGTPDVESALAPGAPDPKVPPSPSD